MTISRPLAASLEVLAPRIGGADPSQALVAAKCAGLMSGYAHRWEHAPYLIRHVERVISGTLYNIDTGASSRTFTLGSKLDVEATEILSGQDVLLDHKSSSQEIADPAAPFWKQLAVEGQVNHYYLQLWQEGRKVDHAVWDAVRKPSISPKLVEKKERAKVLGQSVYANRILDARQVEEFAAGERETLMMYTARLSDDAVRVRPDWYYQRRQVPRLDAEIHEYAQELWGHAQDMILARRTERHPRNSGACMLYGTPCKYLGICSGYDEPDSPKWARKAWMHPELPAVAGADGREVLTNSRIRTFQTCRRKHFYQYEMGIERVDEEEREALYFGSLLHEALEAFFLQLREDQRSTHAATTSAGAPAIGVGIAADKPQVQSG